MPDDGRWLSKPRVFNQVARVARYLFAACLELVTVRARGLRHAQDVNVSAFVVDAADRGHRADRGRGHRRV